MNTIISRYMYKYIQVYVHTYPYLDICMYFLQARVAVMFG